MLTRFLIGFGCILMGIASVAQTMDAAPSNSMKVSTGWSFSSSDNVPGVAVFTNFDHFFKPRLNYSVSLGTTIYSGRATVRYYNNLGSNNPPEYSTRKVDFTTAGIQAGFGLGYSFLRTERHQLRSTIRAVLRYQTTSNPDTYSYATPYPYPDSGPFKFQSIAKSFGGMFEINYEYNLKNNVFISTEASLQYDSHEDGFHFLTLGIGKRF